MNVETSAGEFPCSDMHIYRLIGDLTLRAVRLTSSNAAAQSRRCRIGFYMCGEKRGRRRTSEATFPSCANTRGSGPC